MDRKHLFLAVPSLQTIAVATTSNQRAKASLSAKLDVMLRKTEGELPVVLLLDSEATGILPLLRSYARVLVARSATEAVQLVTDLTLRPSVVITRNKGAAAVTVLREKGFTGKVLFLGSSNELPPGSCTMLDVNATPEVVVAEARCLLQQTK